MAEKIPSPFQAGFWLTAQEKRYILVICALVLVGVTVRFFYLKTEKAEQYIPAGLENAEPGHE